MFIADNWKDFEVIYAGDGTKYERWGKIYLERPDPQAIWPTPKQDASIWPGPHAVYNRSESGGGAWARRRSMPGKWKVDYNCLGNNLSFVISPTSFKHTGLFPEQAANWDFMTGLISEAKKSGRENIRILNLFAYTGGATCACAAAGADEVVHVDASKGMIGVAKENINESGLQDKYVRFIAEDCVRFVEREIRRGRKYDGIIMDPPAYGRGPSGELWKLEDALYDLVLKCEKLLSDDALFFLISSYTAGVSTQASGDILKMIVIPTHGGKVVAEELTLPISGMDIVLPCGCTARWKK